MKIGQLIEKAEESGISRAESRVQVSGKQQLAKKMKMMSKYQTV